MKTQHQHDDAGRLHPEQNLHLHPDERDPDGFSAGCRSAQCESSAASRELNHLLSFCVFSRAVAKFLPPPPSGSDMLEVGAGGGGGGEKLPHLEQTFTF